MPSIHQIIHTGKEFHISFRKRKLYADDYYFYENSYNRGIRKWNRKTNPHYRKFMVHPGSYVTKPDATVEHKVLLNFWGTYEGPSEFELLQKDSQKEYWSNPIAIHTPIFKNGGETGKNTDPYIFGPQFYYTQCEKAALQDLQPGDLVLFGSEFGLKGKEEFYLDTLLIVKDKIKITASEFDHGPKANSLDPLYNQSTGNYETEYVHTGVTFDNRQLAGGSFSFVPCREAGNYPDGFGRPMLKNETITAYLRKPGAYTGTQSTAIESAVKLQQLWHLIAREVLDQGFYLGVGMENLQTYNTQTHDTIYHNLKV